MRLLAAMLVGGAACAASAQTMTYFWTVTTDDGDTNLTPGELAHVSLWVHMDPEVVGFAGTVYSMLGIQNWDTGTLEGWDHIFSAFGEDWPDEHNDFPLVESFQLPPLFNPDFVDDNPVELFRIWWSTDDYTPRVVEVGDANHLNNDVYIDEFGTSVPYEGVPGVARFTVAIPAPGALVALGVGAVAGARRRR